MTTTQIITIVGLVITAIAWINFAEHPTAKNFRRAVLTTLTA